MLVSGLPFRAGEAGCEEQDQHGSGVHGGGRFQPGDWQGRYTGSLSGQEGCQTKPTLFFCFGLRLPQFQRIQFRLLVGKKIIFFLKYFSLFVDAAAPSRRLRVQQKGGLAAETPQLRLGLLKSLILICHSFSFFTGVIS